MYMCMCICIGVYVDRHVGATAEAARSRAKKEVRDVCFSRIVDMYHRRFIIQRGHEHIRTGN